MTAALWASWMSGAAAALAACAAAWQLFLLRHQQDELLKLEREGVAVTWHALTPPNDGKDDIWLYTFQASNPGRYPISNVNVTLIFPVPVERIHHSGVTHPPSATIHVGTPVILGGSVVSWKRTLRITPAPGEKLRQVRGEIEFITSDGERIMNCWPVQAYPLITEKTNSAEPDLDQQIL